MNKEYKILDQSDYTSEETYWPNKEAALNAGWNICLDHVDSGEEIVVRFLSAKRVEFYVGEDLLVAVWPCY